MMGDRFAPLLRPSVIEPSIAMTERVCLSVCLFAHISATARPNFTKYSVQSLHVACGPGLVLVWRRYNALCSLFPVLWMTLE